MIRKFVLIAMVVAGFLLSPQFCAWAQNVPASASTPLPIISPLFADNMVMQRGKANTIWGWSDPGDKIQAEIAGKTASGVAGPDRRWEVKIQPPRAGGPYTMTIKGKQTLELHNVLVGDVWLCGGQSNMEVGLRMARNGAEEVKTAITRKVASSQD